MIQERRALAPPPVRRIHNIEDPTADLNHRPVASRDHELDPISDLRTTDSGALDRIAQAERDQAESRDLLGQGRAQE